MLGMDMMVKNMLGIDPEELKSKLEEGAKFALDKAADLERRIAQIEGALVVIIRQNERLLQACGEVDPPAPALAIAEEVNENAEGN